MGIRIDGFLIIDKPEGMTSLEVVRGLKHIFSIKKAGHIGTLDPFATGVLPIAINEGTKLIPFLQEEPKEYEAIMKLGEETDTEDSTGNVVSKRPLEDLTQERICDIFQKFVGKQRQKPPMFSALKINGKPLYRLARKGIEIEREEREIEIFDIKVEDINPPFIYFRVSCSKGTYIRTLTKEIGRRIGCGGHLFKLRRIQSGPFILEKAISLEGLREIRTKEELYNWLIPLKYLLREMPELIGGEYLLRKVRQGMGLTVRDLLMESLPEFNKGQYLKISSTEGRLVAILKSNISKEDIQNSNPNNIVLRPLRVFHSLSYFDEDRGRDFYRIQGGMS